MNRDQDVRESTQVTASDTIPPQVHRSVNDFSHSMNHGAQAATVHGGIHQYYSNAASHPSDLDDKQIERAVAQADSVIRNYNTSTHRLKIERLSGETLSLERCYINLTLIQQLERSLSEDEHSSFSLQERLKFKGSDPKTEITLQELFTSRKLIDGSISEPRRIYVRGRAGVGKSTLCKKIVFEFDHQRFGNGLFDRLLWLPLHQLAKRDSEYGWKHLIQDTYPLPNPKWKKTIDIFSAQLYEPDFMGRTLLLLDGLDELPQTWNQNDKMFRFLEWVIQESPNIIITSRPQANSVVVGDVDLELETLGFSLDQIDAYLENCVRDSNVIAKMKLFMKARPLIQGLFTIPIQLDAFCCTWPSENPDTIDTSSHSINSSIATKQETITTMTLLYSSISFELCRKDIGRREKQNRFQGLGESEVSRLFADELEVLEELAFQGMVNNMITYSPKSQDTVLSYLLQKGIQLKTPYSSILGRLSFLRSSYIDQNPAKRNYHFLHLTFQEFFAARHFVKRWLTDTRLICLRLMNSNERMKILPIAFLQTNKYDSRYDIFWRFVTGLTQGQIYHHGIMDNHNQSKSVATFFEHLLDKPVSWPEVPHYRLLVHCLAEMSCSNEPVVQDLRREVEELLRDVVVRRYSPDCYDTVGVLCYEAEFPESILRSCLQDEKYASFFITLRILRIRSFVSSETLHAIASFLDHEYSQELSVIAADIILKNWENSPKEVLDHAIQKSVAMINSEKNWVRSLATNTLSGNPCLPQDTITALLTTLKNGSLAT